MSSIGNEFDMWVRAGYKAQGGFYGREALPMMACLWDDVGTAIKALAKTTTDTLGFDYITGGSGKTDDMVGLVWHGGADNADVLVIPWMVPHDYVRDTGRTGNRSKIIVRAKVRKVIASGSPTDNDNLEFHAQASWHSSSINVDTGAESDGDTTIEVLDAVVKGKTIAGATVVPAMAAADSEAAFRWMQWDITAAMSAAQIAALKPGASMTFKLFPHEAVGTNLKLEVAALEVVYTRHLVPADKNRRDQAIG